MNYELDLVTFWYQALWRHKDTLYFYEVFNNFVLFFKGFLFGKDTRIISNQESKYLDKNGMLEQMENHNVMENDFISNKLPLRKMRKNVVQEEEDEHIESDINILYLEDMELEAEIESMFSPLDQLGNMAHHNPSLEIIENETFNEKESFTFHSVVFGKESKKLIIEKSDVKNKKGKSRSEVDLRDMPPS